MTDKLDCNNEKLLGALRLIAGCLPLDNKWFKFEVMIRTNFDEIDITNMKLELREPSR